LVVALDLDAELDKLFSVELAGWVAQRTRLVRALKEEGRRAEAARVQELRKPSLPVWVVNQLARRRRKDVDLLLDAGHRLGAAQLALLSGGDPKAFADARKREQAALKRLRQAAEAILGDRASAGTLDRVVGTLRAAAVSDHAREELARGSLITEVAPSGFEAFAGFQPAATTSKPPPRAAARKGGPGPAKREARAEQAAARREALARARANLKTAEERDAGLARQLREAERAVQQARAGLDSAERELKRLEAEREATARAVDAARGELDAARAAKP
jgi:hypothetical protein